MNDFNQFLTLLRDRQTESENTADGKNSLPPVQQTARPVLPMKGELARPIGADVSEFLESVPEQELHQNEPQEEIPLLQDEEIQSEQESEMIPEEQAVAAPVDDMAASQQPPVEETEDKEENVPQEQETEVPVHNENIQALFSAAEKTRTVADLSKVPVSTPEKPTKGSLSVAKTVVAKEHTRAIRPDALSLFDVQIKKHNTRPVTPEKAASADGTASVAKTKQIGEGKGSLLRAIAKTARESDQADGQIMMEGFDANDPVQTDEFVMEEELRSVREKRIEEFGLPKDPTPPVLPAHTEPPKTKTLPLPAFLAGLTEKFADRETPFTVVPTEEYKMHEDRRRVSTQLRDTMRSIGIKAAVHAGLGLILLLINLITTISANANNGFFTVFGASVSAYAVFNLIFFIPSAVLLIPDFKNAIITILKLRARTEAALLGMYFAVFVQNIALFFTELQPEHDYHMFTGACVMMGALYTASKIFWIKNTRYCFKQAGITENKMYLRSVRDSQALRNLLCENNVDGVCVDFSLKTKFVSDFLKRSSDAARSAMPRSILTPVLAGLCVLCGIVAAIVQGSMLCGISAVAGAACLSFPVCGVVIGSLLLCETNRTLAAKKACVGSLRDARNVVTADHLAFGGKDLFRVKLVKTATVDGVSEKAAMLTAAILAKKAGDTMAAAFAPVLVEYEKRLPAVEDFAVEEKLGVSAWVDNCRVLLGSAQMLVNHNINPGKVGVLNDDEQNLYLAIEGNAVAVFTVQYVCRENLSVNLNAVSQTGVNLLVRTTDPNLTAENIQNAASLPENSVRIVPKAGGELFDRLYENVSERESAGIIGAGGFSSLCDGIGAAVKLDRSGRMVAYICTASSVVGVCAALLLCLTGSIGKASGWSAVVLQIMWNAAAFLLPQLFYKLSALKKIELKKGKSKETKAENNVAAVQNVENDVPTAADRSEQLNFVLSNAFMNENLHTDEE